MDSFLKSFEVTSRWTGAGAEISAVGCPTLEVSSLALRGLVGPRWFPEALLVAAIDTDLMDRFVRLARQRGYRVVSYESSAVAQLETSEDGRAQLTTVVLRPQVAVEGASPDAVRGLLQEALATSDLGEALTLALQLQPTVLRCGAPSELSASP